MSDFHLLVFLDKTDQFILLVAKMPFLFPTQGTLYNALNPATPISKSRPAGEPKRTPLQARSELYTAWSVVDDAKDKANALSAEATKEFEKASAKAQAKAGTIEMYSPGYYAACTFGGLLACVRSIFSFMLPCFASNSKLKPCNRSFTVIDSFRYSGREKV